MGSGAIISPSPHHYKSSISGHYVHQAEARFSRILVLNHRAGSPLGGTTQEARGYHCTSFQGSCAKLEGKPSSRTDAVIILSCGEVTLKGRSQRLCLMGCLCGREWSTPRLGILWKQKRSQQRVITKSLVDPAHKQKSREARI